MLSLWSIGVTGTYFCVTGDSMTQRECTYLIPPDKSPVVSTSRLKGMMVYRPIIPWGHDATIEMIRVPYAQWKKVLSHIFVRILSIETNTDTVLYCVTLTWDSSHREPVLLASFCRSKREKGVLWFRTQ